MSDTNGTGALFENSLLLSLTVHIPGNSAQGDISSLDTTANKDLLRLTKQLLKSPEYEALQSVANRIRSDIKRMCLGGSTESYRDSNGVKRQVGKGLQSFVKSGVYFVPLGMVTKIDAYLKRMIPEFDAARAKFVEMYELRQEEAQIELGDQYCDSDYKSVETLGRSCFVEYKYITVGVPDKLSKIKKELWEEEKKKAQAQWAEATEEIRGVLAVGLKNLVDGMMDALSPGKDGKTKKLYDTTVEKLKEFLLDFPGRNIINDQGLESLVDQTQEILKGKTPEKIRKDAGLKEEIRQKLSTVKAQLDKSVENMPSRVVELD